MKLKKGDRVTLTGTIEHVHTDLVTVRLDVPDGEYEPSITFHPGRMKKVEQEEGNGSDQAQDS